MTPLDCIKQYKADNPEYADVKMGYAGRLDPMAEGLLLVLVGEENKRRAEYLTLNKEYDIEVLFGVSTDTFDVLGRITESADCGNEIETKVQQALPAFIGDITQTYPPYSSMTVQGKPLYWWAREGKLDRIDIPSAQRTIHALKHTGTCQLTRKEVLREVKKKLAHMRKGTFRKEDIIQDWESFGAESDHHPMWIMSFTVVCSSGTYMRALANDLGHAIGVPALAWSIHRTRVGDIMLPKQPQQI